LSFVGNADSSKNGSDEMKRDFAATSMMDAYIAAFPENVQDVLQTIRDIIKHAAPEAEEAIKYRIPTFVLNGNLVHFAAFQNHVGFYPTPSGLAQFKDALSSYKCAKGSVQFPLDSPIPYHLIRRIVKFRVKENRDKMATTTKRKNSK